MGDCYIVRRGGGSDGASKFPEFTYTGDYQVIDDGVNGKVQNWRVKFLTSGTLKFTKNPGSIDVFLVGGGGNAVVTYAGGGGGGYTKTVRNVVALKDTPYSIVVGGSAGASSAFSQTANPGQSGSGVGSGGNGGSGGGGHLNGNGGSDGSNGSAGSYQAGGTGQGSTTREFGESGATLYSGGGGANSGYGGNGGGASGYNITKGSTNAAPNTGGGGGGNLNTSSGLGGSGIVIIRNARG